jgi:hypothetical protein
MTDAGSSSPFSVSHGNVQALRAERIKDAVDRRDDDGAQSVGEGTPDDADSDGPDDRGKRYIDHWTEAGFECGIPIKNTGAGAAMMRIEAARRVFPRCWFNDSTTEAGRDALGYYHERQDEKRSIGLGPEHDWSSHAADAFGYMAIAYEEPPANSRRD